MILAAAAVAAISVATPAAARDKGFYTALSIGLASVNDVGVTYYDDGGTFGGSGARDTLDGELELQNAAEFKGVLGYDFGRVRADVEVAYSRNSVQAITVTNVNGSPITLTAADAAEACDYLEVTGCTLSGNSIAIEGGRVRQLSALGNIWLDLPIGKTLTPYVGGGVGVGGFETDGEGKASFTWQLGAGVAVALTETIALTADYRYRQINGANIAFDNASGFEVGKIRTNSFSAGLRFTF